VADIFCLSVGTSGSQAYQLLQSNGATLVVESVDVGAIGGGITQLTQDVLAGPGGGSQAATVVQASGSIAGVLNLAGAGSSASTVNLGTASGVSAVNIGTSAGGAGIIIGAAAASVELPCLAGSGTRMVVASAAGVLSTEAIVTGGITQLTGDVLAGPGSGSVAATVDSISGNVGGVVPITSPIRLIPAAPSATTGTINLPNGATISFAYTTGHDVAALTVDGSGNVDLGTDGNAQGVNIGGGTVSPVNVGGVNTSAVNIGTTSTQPATITIGSASSPVVVSPLAGSGTRMVTATAAGQLGTAAVPTGGITQLTGDVLAGPGSGSVAATVDQITGAISGLVGITHPIQLIPAAPSATTGTINLPNGASISFAYTTGHDVNALTVDGTGFVDLATDANAQGCNVGTGTGVATINIGTGGAEGANNINIGGSGTTTKIAALQGTGTRVVTASSTGVLGTGEALSSVAQVLYSLTGNPAVQVVSTAAETTLFSFVLPGNTLPTNGEIRCHLRGRIFNNVGTEGQTFRFYFGASVVLFFTLTNGASSTNSVAEDFDFTIVGAGATNAQYFNCTYLSNNGSTDGTANSFSGATSNCGTGQATGTLDTTTNQTIKATCQNAVSNANLYFSLYSAKLLLV